MTIDFCGLREGGGGGGELGFSKCILPVKAVKLCFIILIYMYAQTTMK